MSTHHRTNSLSCFVRVVERYRADIMVQNMCLYDAMEQMAADETKVAINRCCSALDEGPRLIRIVRKARIGMLKERDCHFLLLDLIN